MSKLTDFLDQMTYPLFLGTPLYEDGVASCRDLRDCPHKILSSWLHRWGIDDISSLDKKLKWLFYTGYRSQFNELSYSLSTMSKTARDQYIAALSDHNKQKHQLYWVNQLMGTLPPSGIAAFDYSLLLALYQARTQFTEDNDSEFKRLCMDTAKVAQSKYRSWHEYFSACIAGSYFQSLPHEVAFIHEKNNEALEVLIYNPKAYYTKWTTPLYPV